MIFGDECKGHLNRHQSFCMEKSRQRVVTMLSWYTTIPKFSVMVQGCITFEGVGTNLVVDGNINAIYKNIRQLLAYDCKPLY